MNRKEQARERKLQARYGISTKEYGRILAVQGGCCAVCGRPPKTRRLSVDHDHRLAKQEGVRRAVRGLLCMACNRGLARFNDDADLLGAASDYIKNPPARRVLTEREGA